MTKLEERLSYLFDLTDYAAKDIAAELEGMVRKQIASEIVQPYADKGFKCYEESVEAAKEDDSERSNEFYWDGFSDCATRILEELKVTNKGE